MNRNQIKDLTTTFAIETIDFSRNIQHTKKEFIITKQLIRSGTSIGANVYEAEYAQSRPDFIHKLSIALKEANETKYWLILLSKSSIQIETDKLQEKVVSIIKILSTIILNAKNKPK